MNKKNETRKKNPMQLFRFFFGIFHIWVNIFCQKVAFFIFCFALLLKNGDVSYSTGATMAQPHSFTPFLFFCFYFCRFTPKPQPLAYTKDEKGAEKGDYFGDTLRWEIMKIGSEEQKMHKKFFFQKKNTCDIFFDDTRLDTRTFPNIHSSSGNNF